MRRRTHSYVAMRVNGDDPFVDISGDDGIGEVDDVQREILRVWL